MSLKVSDKNQNLYLETEHDHWKTKSEPSAQQQPAHSDASANKRMEEFINNGQSVEQDWSHHMQVNDIVAALVPERDGEDPLFLQQIHNHTRDPDIEQMSQEMKQPRADISFDQIFTQTFKACEAVEQAKKVAQKAAERATKLVAQAKGSSTPAQTKRADGPNAVTQKKSAPSKVDIVLTEDTIIGKSPRSDLSKADKAQSTPGEPEKFRVAQFVVPKSGPKSVSGTPENNR